MTREQAISAGLQLEDEVEAFMWAVANAMGCPGQIPLELYGAHQRLMRAVGEACWRMASRADDACEIGSPHEQG